MQATQTSRNRTLLDSCQKYSEHCSELDRYRLLARRMYNLRLFCVASGFESHPLRQNSRVFS